jgi:uncharacterized protein YllA (UPF0747 family)
MIHFPLNIPVDEFDGDSRLYRDYLSSSDNEIKRILGGFTRDGASWTNAIKGYDLSRGRGGEWEKLLEGIGEYNQSIGVADEVIDKLGDAANGGVRFVVTGQQPGVLGGTLLTLYKLSTAIALAEHVERTFDVPCVPLFWNGADDVDFREIRDMFLVDCDLTAVSASIAESACPASSPIGDISPEAIGDVWDSVAPIVARCPSGEFVSEIARSAIDSAADHAELSARILSVFTSGRAAFVDGRSPAVRDFARELFLNFFDHESDVRESVEEAGRSLEAAGYHAQLWLGPDSGVFMVEDGRRKKIADAQRPEARTLMKTDVGRFSPGVVLRSLVQDYVFQPVAAVLGPAEIAYRAQLKGVYRSMSVRRPVVFPRMPATYLAPFVVEMLIQLESTEVSDVRELVLDPGATMRRVHSSQNIAEVDDAAKRFLSLFRAGAGDFLVSIDGVLDRGTVAKTNKRLGDVERRLAKALETAGEAGKSAALSRWPFLEGLESFLTRKGKPQERYLSVLTPFLFSGADAVDLVDNAAESFVDRALDGRPSHVVYSSRREIGNM